MSQNVNILLNVRGCRIVIMLEADLIGGPAQKAGISPSLKLIAANNRLYAPSILREAVQAATAAKK